MLNVQLLLDAYQEFYKKYFILSEKYRFKPKASNIKDIEVFLENSLLKEKSIQFIHLYLTFQFDYWSNLDLESNYGKINTKYIFGKKAIKRWVDRNQEFDYKLYESKISFSFFEKSITIDINQIDLLKKKQFLNSDFGFRYCIDNTSLYNDSHYPCIMCQYKNSCKQLVENYKNAKAKN